ncbi:hypothetical protein H6790_01710 [Candidatus Nomurabacteria bacterium]|nr:hypothetical protein [Candidatus Nomurabacteria bacterium]MCB9820640.1 hypothetical protein [Candidatus Nomurabacteria bacterium]
MIYDLNFFVVIIPALVAVVIGMITTPIYTNFFYKHKLWRKRSRTESLDNAEFKALANEKELNTPRVGGIIIWLTTLITSFIFFLFSKNSHSIIGAKINFISLTETLAPLIIFVFGSIIGLFDDLIQIYLPRKFEGDPIFLRYLKLLSIVLISLVVGIILVKIVGINYVYIPKVGHLVLGYMFIPFFIVITTAVFSSSVIDGIDGLAGGVLAIIYSAYALIAALKGLPDLATLCAVVAGSIFVFLWFNIPPARFYLGETGMIGLTMLLSTISFLTDTVFLLPIIAFPLFITSLSVIMQWTSKKLFGQRILKVAPLHHHFEAKGWSRYKVVMRYWLFTIFFAIIGIVLSVVM